jgi:predicted permease
MAFFSNIRFSLRILRKHAKLACIAVFSLAIGLAAASIGLSTYNALLVRPPAVPEPHRLLTIFTVTPDQPFNELSYPEYLYYRDNNGVFSGLCAIPFNISMQPIFFESREKAGLINAVSDNYFSVLGVQPFLGRWFAVGDDVKPDTTAVMSYVYWKWLGSDPRIIGKTVKLNNTTFTIIGVAPKNFAGTILTDLPDLWFPLSHNSGDWRTNRTSRNLSLIGRMKPGVTRAQALANLQELSRQIAAAYPATNVNRVAGVTQTTMLPPDSVTAAKVVGMVILGIVGLVLFAACANVANLLLALAGARRHEILIRAALGATRGRLLRQLLLDSTLISVAAGLFGYAFSFYALRRLMEFKPYVPGLGYIPITPDFRPDFTVLCLTVALVFAVGIATGLAPGLQASTPNLAAALSGEIVIGGTRKGRVRNFLVVIQVAACTVVLIGVGLCYRSLQNAKRIDIGFSARNVAIFDVNDMQTLGYSEKQGRAIYDRIRESISQLPGVDSVSLADSIPLEGTGQREHVHVAGSPADSDEGEAIPFGVADGAFFKTLGIPLLAGRAFDATETAKSPEVVIINHTMAEKYWPNLDPVGRAISVEAGKRRLTVIGVVGNSKYSDLDEPPQPAMYFALAQHYLSGFVLLVGTHGNPAQWIAPLEETMHKVDPDIGYLSLTMEQELDGNFYVSRVALICVSGFGVLALILSAVGLYGAVFYSVSERTREMGIRVALGAEQWDLWKLILRQTCTITAIGICLGIAGGVAAGILARSLLYGIQPVEAIVFLGVAIAMIAMTLVTAYSAARPWMRVDPMKSVRHI